MVGQSRRSVRLRSAGTLLIVGLSFALIVATSGGFRWPLQPSHSAPRRVDRQDPEPRRTPDGAPHLSIAVRGNRLINGSGQTITLHGVNIDGTEWSCLYGHPFAGPSDERSIQAMAAWHINAVRIPLNEDCWLGINGAPRNIFRYRRQIRGYVARLNRMGFTPFSTFIERAGFDTLTPRRGVRGFLRNGRRVPLS